jgi:hypothetical protein
MSLTALYQSAGVCGLLLGLYNLWRATREPVRVRQAKLRNDLLELLYDLRPRIRSAQIDLKYQESFSTTVPSEVTSAGNKINDISEGLLSPGLKRLIVLKAQLVTVSASWNLVTLARLNDQISAEERQRARDEAETELEAQLEKTLVIIKGLIDATNKIEKGNRWAYFKHKDRRWLRSFRRRLRV